MKNTNQQRTNESLTEDIKKANQENKELKDTIVKINEIIRGDYEPTDEEMKNPYIKTAKSTIAHLMNNLEVLRLSSEKAYRIFTDPLFEPSEEDLDIPLIKEAWEAKRASIVIGRIYLFNYVPTDEEKKHPTVALVYNAVEKYQKDLHKLKEQNDKTREEDKIQKQEEYPCCTPNHKVITSKGWVELKNIHSTSDVIMPYKGVCSFGEPVCYGSNGEPVCYGSKGKIHSLEVSDKFKALADKLLGVPSKMKTWEEDEWAVFDKYEVKHDNIFLYGSKNSKKGRFVYSIEEDTRYGNTPEWIEENWIEASLKRCRQEEKDREGE